jgi:hypothetical protein
LYKYRCYAATSAIAKVSAFVDLLLDPLLLQAAEEGLDDSVEAPMYQDWSCGVQSRE